MIGVFVEWDWLPNRQMRKVPVGHVITESGCWEWAGCLGWRGYGRIRYNGRMQQAHRISYEHSVSPIPEGMHVDHICRNPRCVNWHHLRLVTPRQNVLENSAGLAAANVIKTQCLHGHLYTEENTYTGTRPDGRIYRQCRACGRAKWRRRTQRARLNVGGNSVS